jgi:hypothetical protein
MHQTGKKIKERGNFLLFQAGNEGLQKGGFGESLQKCSQGTLIGFPVQAKADGFRFQGGGGYFFCVHGGVR